MQLHRHMLLDCTTYTAPWPWIPVRNAALGLFSESIRQVFEPCFLSGGQVFSFSHAIVISERALIRHVAAACSSCVSDNPRCIIISYGRGVVTSWYTVRSRGPNLPDYGTGRRIPCVCSTRREQISFKHNVSWLMTENRTRWGWPRRHMVLSTRSSTYPFLYGSSLLDP